MSQCDRAFGPRVAPTCRPLDFTLYFEDIFFAIAPNAIFLSSCLLPLSNSLFAPPVIKRSRLLFLKAFVFVVLSILQFIFLILRTRDLNIQTNASLAADVLGSVTSLAALALSWLQHHRSERPSSLLAIYLAALSLVMIARVRTLWFTEDNVAPAVLLTLTLLFTFWALTLESLGKTRSLRQPEKLSQWGPEPFIGFWALVAYAWVVETCRKGYTKILSIDDLPALDYRIASKSMEKKLRKMWKKYDKSERYSLFRACFRAFAMSLLAGVLPRLCMTAFSFAQPFMIERLVDFFSNRDTPDYVGKSLIGAYALVFLGMAVSQSVFWYHTYRFIVQLRGALISLIYCHTVETKALLGSDIDGVALMGADVERIVLSLVTIHELWASTIDICIALVLLERQLGVACLVPAVVVIVFLGITFKIAPSTKAAQRAWVEKVEERVGVTSTILSAMRAVKMLGLSDKVLGIITKARETEIISSKRFRKLFVARVFFCNSPVELAPLGTFALFVALSARTGDSLVVGRAFTSLSLISLITDPAWTLVQAIPDLAQCLSSFDRIQEFCNRSSLNDKQMNNDEASSEGTLSTSKDETGFPLNSLTRSGGTSDSSNTLISFEKQDFTWKRAGIPTLQGITTAISANKFTVVLGATGSGKSTFLESIIGETFAIGGKTERKFSCAAYCSQVPWLVNGTIKENIVGGSRKPVDREWYNVVVRASGLLRDLEQMPQGDETLVGHEGGKLSGGQRQRVSLARAVYSRCQLLLLDDIFSGVDTKNVVFISEQLFGVKGLLRQNNTTVVLVTHTLPAIILAEEVIVFEDGQIIEHGTLEELRSTGGYVSRLVSSQPSEPAAEKASDAGEDAQFRLTPSIVQDIANADEDASDLKRRSGDFSIYSYYSASCGHKNMAAYMLLNVLWMCSSQFSVLVVKWWSAASSQNNGTVDNGRYLGAYAAINLSASLLSIAACWLLFVTIISKSAERLHLDILKAAIGASLQFFNSTDIGSIINRFTQDMELTAISIPINLLNYTGAVCVCIAKAILLAINAKFLAIALPFVALMMVFLQKFYLRTSRQVRLLDIEAKAPLYLQFLETKKGASTIRAFNWQQAFIEKFEVLLDQSMRPVYLRYCLQQWLSFFLSLLVTILAILLVTVVVIWRDSFDPASVGLSLLTVIAFNKSLEELIRYWTILETSIGAVGRIKSFARDTVPEESQLDIAFPKAAPEHWPINGSIKFTNVSARYSQTSEPALKGLSVAIDPGQKVAVCGPSGSGKTSFILSILHMINLEGSIQIDGVDISQLSLSDLRSRINVIPQEPLLMPGSVRFNIDPFEQASQESIIAVLRRLRLWDQIERDGGLDGKTSLASWSVGERQLLCMARAMVRRSQILILDEATSSVDTATEALMQEVLETDFASQTIISVVHRLGYIRRYDKVLVIKNGELAEYDTPQALLSRQSILAEMATSSLYGG